MAITTDVQTTKELRGEGAAFRSFLTDLNKPVSTELSKQILEALTTGGATERVPIISARLEAAKKANAASFGLTEDELARVGITGDPAGQRILATQRRESAFAESQIPANVAQELIGLAPEFIRSNQQNLTTLAGAETRETKKTELDITDILTTFAALGGSDLLNDILQGLGFASGTTLGSLTGQALGSVLNALFKLAPTLGGPIGRLLGDVLRRIGLISDPTQPAQDAFTSGQIDQEDADFFGSPLGQALFGAGAAGLGLIVGGSSAVPAAEGSGGFLSGLLNLINPSSASAPTAGVGAAGGAVVPTGGATAPTQPTARTPSEVFSTFGPPPPGVTYVGAQSGGGAVWPIFREADGTFRLGAPIVLPDEEAARLEENAIPEINFRGLRGFVGESKLDEVSNFRNEVPLEQRYISPANAKVLGAGIATPFTDINEKFPDFGEGIFGDIFASIARAAPSFFTGPGPVL